jgi:flagellar hook-associated protein 3 FlgL
MTLKISTAMLHRQGVENMLRQQAALAETQNQLATGRRVLTAAASPVDWARAARLDETLAALGRYHANAGAAADRLGFEEGALASASDILQRARELAVQANGGTLDAGARGIIATELRSLREQLLQIANSTDAEGHYLFAGSRSAAAPFAFAGSGAAYAGDSQARLLSLSAHRDIADGDSGDRVFMNLTSGNGTFAVAAGAANAGTAQLGAAGINDLSQWDGDTYTLTFSGGNYEVRDSASALVTSGTYSSGASIAFRGIRLSVGGTPADGDQFQVSASAAQDVFTTLQKLIDFAESPIATSAQRAQNQTLFFGALQELDAAHAHFVDLRGSVGARLSAVDDAQSSLSAQMLLAEQHLSELRDLDYAEAASRFALQQTMLEAAQLSYQRVQGLSLFDYLR